MRHIGEKEGRYMSHGQNIDDGYEEMPWADDSGDNIRIIKDFLPSPEVLKGAKSFMVSDEKAFTADDLKVIEKMVAERNLTATALMAGILHEFVSNSMAKGDKR